MTLIEKRAERRRVAGENLRMAAEEFVKANGYMNLKAGQIFHTDGSTIVIFLYREEGK